MSIRLNNGCYDEEQSSAHVVNAQERMLTAYVMTPVSDSLHIRLSSRHIFADCFALLRQKLFLKLLIQK